MEFSDVLHEHFKDMSAHRAVYLHPVDAAQVMKSVLTWAPTPELPVPGLFAKAAGLEWFTDETVPQGEIRFE
jgi:hypothetical protein